MVTNVLYKKYQSIIDFAYCNLESLEDDINRMKKVKSYKGIRHASGHKVRGQRTYSNGRRGLALGVSKRKGD